MYSSSEKRTGVNIKPENRGKVIEYPLQFISSSNSNYSTIEAIKLALAGGCKWIQLRLKDFSTDIMRPFAIRTRDLCDTYGATFIIDDNVLLAQETGADGVHLGKNDMPVSEARKILGDKFIIGGTANTLDDVLRLYEAGADYIGCGPFRFTETKKNLSPILGLDGYNKIVAGMRQAGCRLPIYAIGGITIDDIDDIMQTGVNGIALSGAILNAPDPEDMMRQVLAHLNIG